MIAGRIDCSRDSGRPVGSKVQCKQLIQDLRVRERDDSGFDIRVINIRNRRIDRRDRNRKASFGVFRRVIIAWRGGITTIQVNCGDVIGAVDRDIQSLGNATAVAIRNRVDKGVTERVANLQRLDRRQRIVQRVSVLPIAVN